VWLQMSRICALVTFGLPVANNALPLRVSRMAVGRAFVTKG